MKYPITFDGRVTQVNCEIAGQGKPVVILHGFTLDHRAMMGCMEPLFKTLTNYRRIYVDLPGMGGTRADLQDASSDNILGILKGLIELVTGGQNFLLVGESYGGYLARGLLCKMANRIDGILLVAPLVKNGGEKPPHQVLVRKVNPLELLDAQDAAGFEAVSVVQTPEILKRYRDEILCGVHSCDEVFLDQLKGEGYFFSFDPDDIQEYARPVAIIVGKQDSWVGYQAAFALLDRYPRATFAVLDKAGHNVQFDAKELFGRLVLDWLDRVK